MLRGLYTVHHIILMTDFSTSPHRTSESCLCIMLSNVKSHKFIKDVVLSLRISGALYFYWNNQIPTTNRNYFYKNIADFFSEIALSYWIYLYLFTYWTCTCIFAFQLLFPNSANINDACENMCSCVCYVDKQHKV